MIARVPIVNYLVLDDRDPHLVARECSHCAARFLSQRIACANCGHREFRLRRLVDAGRIGSFTIVHRAAPGIPTPYVSALVDLDDGTTVKSNIITPFPDPDHVRLHMAVRLQTFEAGADDDGVVAVAFGYAPQEDRV